VYFPLSLDRQQWVLFIRPPGTIVREGLMFYCSLFFSSRDLRGSWADLREILPHRRKYVQSTNAGPKIWRPALKKFSGQKNTLNLPDFRPLPTLSSNISGMDRDIQKTKLLPAFSPALDGKSPVNFGPLSTAFSRLMFTHEIDFFGRPYFGP